MKRGDVVIMAAAGDYGKPPPAVIVQTDAFPESHASVVVCPMTSDIVEAPDFRVTIHPSERNGFKGALANHGDIPVTVRRSRIGQPIGQLDDGDVGRLNIALSLWLS